MSFIPCRRKVVRSIMVFRLVVGEEEVAEEEWDVVEEVDGEEHADEVERGVGVVEYQEHRELNFVDRSLHYRLFTR